MSSLIRINKLLASLGIASRRKADDLIKQGSISINGKVLNKPGAMIDIESDTLSVDGKKIPLKIDTKKSYYLLYKPKDCVTTVSDTHGRKTVMDLVPNDSGLFPVGRLDQDTTGVLIITNDGDLAHRLMHPRYEIDKIYEVTLKSKIKRGDILKLNNGVDIGDDRPSICEVIDTKKLKSSTKLTIKLHEGRKRQIRRTFTKLGYDIEILERVNYCGIEADIKYGTYRKLTESEVSHLKKKVGLLSDY